MKGSIYVNVMLDNEKFNRKPNGMETAAIQNRIINNNVRMTIEELSNVLVQGQTIIPAHFEGGITTKTAQFIEMQLILIDIDNENGQLTLKNILDICRVAEAIPNFIYTTFSSTKEKPKFRLAFVLDEPITSTTEAEKIILALHKLLSVNNETIADAKCKNVNRLYYGGKDLVYKDYLATINAASIINKSSNIILDNVLVTSKNKANDIVTSEKHKENNIRYIQNR